MDATRPPTLLVRFRTLLPLKLLLFVLVTTCICIPYFGLQHVSLFPVTLVPETRFDQAVPFLPSTTIVYFSMYPFLALPAALMTRREDLARYSAAMLAITAISSLLFLLCPSGVTRPPAPDPLDPLYAIILATDHPVNACPSLHAAFALLAALCLARMLGRRHPVARGLTWLWAAAIYLSTLTTKQHVVLDLVGGSAVTLAVFFWLYGGRAPGEAPFELI